MLSIDTIYVGVDPNSGRKSFAYAALDRELRVVAVTDGDMEDVLTLLRAYDSVIVAINSPSGVNHGLVREKMKGEMLAAHQIRGAELRLAEYELRERGIPVAATPARPELCPAWMQLGFELYQILHKIGYTVFTEGSSTHQIMETHPHACYCVLIGQNPLPKPTLEGRLQRQLILYERGVRVKDPMDFFEELTRRKLLKGILPTNLIYLPEHLDALIASYTAWLSIHEPDDIIKIGAEQEGQIVLPVKDLITKY
jgi:predicted nuclease with RNAse H fold